MLPTVLWLILFLFATGSFLCIIREISKNILLLKNALTWLLISVILIIFAIFPHVAEWLAVALGSEAASDFSLPIAVIVLLIMEIRNSVLISKHENCIKILSQELSIMESEEKQENRERKNDQRQ